MSIALFETIRVMKGNGERGAVTWWMCVNERW